MTYLYAYCWRKNGRHLFGAEYRHVSFSDSRRIADIEIRRANQKTIATGCAPVVLSRESRKSRR